MQRVLLLLATVFALYACSGTVPYRAGEEQTPAPIVELGHPLSSGSTGAAPSPAAVAPVQAAPLPIAPEAPVGPPIIVEPNAVAHIALLLPLQSPIFAGAANAVQQGFMSASRIDRTPIPVRVYSNFDENESVVATYRQAVSEGAVAVVGPLTRTGVAALAGYTSIQVPTISLNVVDAAPARNLYFFGMSIETEARQIAQLAQRQGLRQAIIVTSREPLSKRLQAAFEDQWSSGGGTILREVEFNDDTSIFADITDIPGTMVFIAADAIKARLIRPYLSNNLPIYATSRVFVGNANTLLNYDLNDIHFVDMPWLLQPDNPAVMIYPRATPPLSIDNERLYALGVDAYRLIRRVLVNRVSGSSQLDGVSGHISLIGQTFQRTEKAAVFVQGQAQLEDSSHTQTIQMFPEQPVNNP
ncbi:MAG: penicillin-binding protein activator [Gallionella sp.]